MNLICVPHLLLWDFQLKSFPWRVISPQLLEDVAFLQHLNKTNKKRHLSSLLLSCSHEILKCSLKLFVHFMNLDLINESRLHTHGMLTYSEHTQCTSILIRVYAQIKV